MNQDNRVHLLHLMDGALIILVRTHHNCSGRCQFLKTSKTAAPLGIMHVHATAMINCIKTQTIIHGLPRQVVELRKVKLHVPSYIQSVVVINYPATVSDAGSSRGGPRRSL